MDFTIAEKPLVPSINNKAQELKINKTYFYEMPSGNIEAVESREAWELHKKRFKQIGVSDGSLYRKAMEEARELFKTEGLEKSQERLRKGVEEEIEAARGHFEVPPNNDVFGNGRQDFMNKSGMR